MFILSNYFVASLIGFSQIILLFLSIYNIITSQVQLSKLYKNIFLLAHLPCVERVSDAVSI